MNKNNNNLTYWSDYLFQLCYELNLNFEYNSLIDACLIGGTFYKANHEFFNDSSIYLTEYLNDIELYNYTCNVCNYIKDDNATYKVFPEIIIIREHLKTKLEKQYLNSVMNDDIIKQTKKVKI